MPGQFPGTAAEIQHAPPGGDLGPRPRRRSCASRPVSRPLRRVLGRPAGRLGVEKPANLFGVGQRLVSHDRPVLPAARIVARIVASIASVGRSASPATACAERGRARAVALVLAALPDRLTVHLGRPEVIDDDPVRRGLDLDPLLTGHRLRAAVGDDGQRAVREPQRHRGVVAVGRSRNGTSGQGRDVLDRGADQRLRGVDEVAHLAEQPATLPPVVVPVTVRDPPGRNPVHHELRRRDPGERRWRPARRGTSAG